MDTINTIEESELRELSERLHADVRAKALGKMRSAKRNRVMAFATLIGLVLSHTAIILIDWNDCAVFAIWVGYPTTFTLDRGCWVMVPNDAYSIQFSGAYNAPISDDHIRNHPALRILAEFLRAGSFIAGMLSVPKVINGYLAQRQNTELAENMMRGYFFDREGEINQATEVASASQSGRVYRLDSLNVMSLAFVGLKYADACTLRQEYEAIEEIREAMERIAPLNKWKVRQ